MINAILPLSIVVAVAENGVIGRDNDLPWRLKADLRRFKELTLGKPMIMGRKTWDSIGRPLPGRETVVLTRDRGFHTAGAQVAHDWVEAKRIAASLAGRMSASGVAVVGGAALFSLALPETDHIHLTCVHTSPAGDVLFPPFDKAAFVETGRTEHPRSADDEHAFTFIDLVRRSLK